MSHFASKPLYTASGKRKGRVVYTLANDVTYKSKKFGTIKIPKGFKTDLVSVPGTFKGLLRQNDPMIRDAALLHDYVRSEAVNMPPGRAAELFGEALRETGVTPVKANILEGVVKSVGKFFEQPDIK